MIRELRPEMALRRETDRNPSVGPMIERRDWILRIVKDEEPRNFPAGVRAVLPDAFPGGPQDRFDIRLGCLEVIADAEVELASRRLGSLCE